jgi:hypothetical protein
MVYNHIAGDITTPQQRRPSDHIWSKSTLRTPSGGRKSNSHTAGPPRARASPYAKPDEVRITLSPSKSCAMELFTPKDHMAKLALQRKAAGSTPSPMTPWNPHVTSSTHPLGESPLFGQPKLINIPRSLGVHQPSIELVSPTMEGTPREKERPPVPVPDPTCPTVRLLRVMYKCWDDDTTKQSDWALTDALLNGRNDERDRRGMWNTLGGAVFGLWPDHPGLRKWIMRNEPSDDDTIWFKSTGSIGVNGEEYITDSNQKTKVSTLDRVGFHSS